MSLVERLNALLPQTQCTRCGYPDCRSYAQAIVSGQAEINQCPPGGAEGISRLAALTGRSALPLNPSFGREGPRRLAYIDENWCIGCTLCVSACPTDAIFGTSKRMHTVIEAFCTGCELCLPACPVDCIEMEAVGTGTGWAAWSADEAIQAQSRYEWHRHRLAQQQAQQSERLMRQAERKLSQLETESQSTSPSEWARKRAVIEAALTRAKARRSR